ncbi:hypothetical protein K431DRAFT_342301 [Polychaeton citri CBS 116435]|uniref:Uncharacterized protein n=1 Tax=Polychaeton citri CBS 116435 TaxID=1314669 RepID=A0A9P4UTF0_9PEZI|nr:hypothetical protein K431DRAFT_342301 [Polychaeton citri CBS 116435]
MDVPPLETYCTSGQTQACSTCVHNQSAREPRLPLSFWLLYFNTVHAKGSKSNSTLVLNYILSALGLTSATDSSTSPPSVSDGRKVDIVLDETDGLFGSEPSHVFGWPTEDGVWVRREFPADADDLDSVPIGVNQDYFVARDQMQENFSIATDSLKQQDNMEGIRRVIEQAGGQYYLKIRDCPEAMHLV